MGNNDFSDLGGTPATDFSDLGGTPTSGNPTSQAPASQNDIGFNNMGAPLRGASQFLNGIGLKFLPTAAADVYDIGRGIPALFGNTKGFGSRDSQGTYHNIENPFRTPEEENQTRNQANPAGFATDVGKSAISAATLYDGAGGELGGMNIPASPSLFGSGTIRAGIGNAMVKGGIKGLGAGLSQDDVTPGKTAAYAGTSALLEPLIAAMGSGMASKGGVWKKMVSAVEGKNVNWDTIAADARAAAKSKDPQVMKELESLLSQKTPAPATDLLENNGFGPEGGGGNVVDNGFTGAPETPNAPMKPVTEEQMIKETPFKADGTGPRGNPKYNIPQPEDLTHTAADQQPIFPDEPSAYAEFGKGVNPGPDISGAQGDARQALDARVNLGQQLPKNFFDNLFRQVPNEKQEAIKILRQSISDHLKDVAPGIKTPDALYHFYSKMGGDIPTWGKRILGGYAADKVLGNKMGGNSEQLIDALAAIMAGKI